MSLISDTKQCKFFDDTKWRYKIGIRDNNSTICLALAKSKYNFFLKCII